MKSIYLFISVIVSSMFVACSNHIDEKQMNIDEVESIYVSLKDFKNEDFGSSRTSISIGNDGPHYAWAETDTIGIFPSTGRQVEFSMADGAGTQSATFTGGGWGLKSTSTYAAYCPLIGQYYLDKENIPVVYTGQVQDGNNPLEHLGKYDYLFAPASTVVNGSVSFNFQRIGSLARLALTVPSESTYTSLVLKSDQAIFVEEGSIDLFKGNYMPVKYSDRLMLGLSNVSSNEANQTLVVYLMMSPIDMTGSSVYAVLQDNAANCYQGIIESKKMQSGLAYGFSATLEKVDMSSSVLAPSFGSGDIDI